MRFNQQFLVCKRVAVVMVALVDVRKVPMTVGGKSAVQLPREVKLKAEYLLPLADERLWVRDVVEDDFSSFPPAFWFVGAHGGAGCTTMAALIAPGGDAGQQWPIFDEHPLCVVVARATVLGLERAHQVLLQGLREVENVTILGVVVVNDTPGKMPAEIKHKLEVLAPLAQIWHINYLSAIRVLLPEALAQWQPLCEVDRTRKGRKLPVTEQVPLSVVQIGEEIFRAAQDVVAERKQSEREGENDV